MSLPEQNPSKHSFLTWCTSPSAIHRGRLRLVHTKSLLNFLSGMDTSNTE
jgi:hypothetical protein